MKTYEPTLLNRLGLFLRGEAASFPAATRRKVYRIAKALGALATLVLLVLPALPGLGINWEESGVVATVATAVLTVIGHLADANTSPVIVRDNHIQNKPFKLEA